MLRFDYSNTVGNNPLGHVQCAGMNDALQGLRNRFKSRGANFSNP